jgi:hypothetical protein
VDGCLATSVGVGAPFDLQPLERIVALARS